MPDAAQHLDRLQGEVDALMARLADAESRWHPWTAQVAAENRCSAINLVHYWALRQVDLRDVQDRLTGFGLSSLGSGAHIQATMRRVSAAIAAMRGHGWTVADPGCADVAQETWPVDDPGARIARIGGRTLRTGPLAPGPRVVRLQPTRNAHGQVVAAGRGWLTSTKRPSRPPEPGLTTLPVDAKWLAHRTEGDELTLRDTRGSKRRLLLAAAAPGGFVVSTEKTTYLGTGTRLKAGKKDSTKLGELPAVEQSILLAAGDIVQLTRDCTPAPVDDDRSPRIGCTLPELFDNAEVGHRIVFDDGVLGGEVVAVKAARIDVRINHPSHGTAKLFAAKEIAAPDTDLPISGVTDEDLADLAVAIELADIVALSCVRDPADVIRVFDALDRLGGHDLGVLLTMESRHAVDDLPELLLTAMRRRRVGVMIARGDLAAEETARLCEAAHLPVTWARD
ncbi:pyruvate kinase [Mycobacterium sp. RTGN5]|uniref:pyruvate kinase n=1 Tax=Mycobacterium sp. RTGN5 TaxID=3016522 RepID=UPI0029C62B0D|nr:pyruvate kinase [Mycobacterium sp. RTGN5]